MSSPKSAMEPPAHGGPGSASDYGRLHRFPDPPPPPQAHEANALPGDAALARRREELLWEFHNMRIRQDMIFRELADIERAMVARFTPTGHWTLQVLPPSRDYCHSRPSLVTSLEEAPLCMPSRCPEYPPCLCQGTQKVRPPPVYPHVERSPSPIAMRDYSEDRRSPSKQTPAEEALVPALANAGVKPIRFALAREEVTPEHKDVVVRERKADVPDEHGVQSLYEGGNQGCGQRKSAEITMVDRINGPVQQSCSYKPEDQEYKTFDQKLLECSTPRPEQPQPSSNTKQQKECRSSVKVKEHQFSGHVELCQSPRKQTEFVDTLLPAAADGSTQLSKQTPLPVSICQEVAPVHLRAVSGEPKVDSKNGHSVQPLLEIKNQRSGQKKVDESAMEGGMDKPLQPLRHRLGGQENATYNENKRIEFSERTPERTASGVKRRLTEATPPVKKPKPPEEWNCTVCQVDSSCERTSVDEHLAGRPHRSNVEALRARSKSGERSSKAAPGQWNKNSAKDGEPLSRDGKESLAEHTRSRHQEEKPRGEGSVHRTAVKDRLEPAPVPEPAPPSWTCTLCQAHCPTEHHYYEHLRGRRHRENTEAVLADFRSESERRDGGDDGYTADWERACYCKVCDVQCYSEKDLASHLAGRRHREALEGRE